MEPYLGELRVFTCGFVPVGWLACNGATLNITAYTGLYALLGTKFGGNGSTTFMLPDLRGAAMLNMGTFAGNTYQVGNAAGTETVALTTATIPPHNHYIGAQTDTAVGNLNNNPPFEIITQPVSGSDTVQAFVTPTPTPTLVTLDPSTLATGGASQPHNNMPPFQTLNVCICSNGYFPPRN
ncbi:phage tail protein [Mucilaginibacter sp. AW1-3]